MAEHEELARPEFEAPVVREPVALESIPGTLPILPLRSAAIFPNLVAPMLAVSARAKALIEAVLEGDGPPLLMATALRGKVEGDPAAADLQRVGSVLLIVNHARAADGAFRLLMQGLSRAQIVALSQHEPFFRGDIRLLADQGEADAATSVALARDVRTHFERLLMIRPFPEEVQELVMSLEEQPARLADLVGSSLDLDLAGKQALLEELDVEKRLLRARDELRRAFEQAQIENDIRLKVKSDIDRNQREYLLRQELDRIRRELGETEDEEEMLQSLGERIEAAGMSRVALAQAQRELERLRQTPPAAAEHGVIRGYLQWLVELPWREQSEDRLSVAAARKVLDEDHWGLEKVKERIVDYIAVLSLKRDLRGPILCFVGPPGTGKTSLGRSIARALGRRFERVALGGVRDEAVVRGHRRTYVGAMPGRIVQHLRHAGTRNPVFMLDEIDKLMVGYAGDPSSALLEVLDPEQNRAFSDHYLEIPFNLSKVLFIATANLSDAIHPTLRDRMEVIEIPGYTEEEKFEIARRYLLPRQRRENGVENVALTLPDETLRRLIGSYTREAGVRNLEREIGAVCRKVARRCAEKDLPGAEGFQITPEKLPALLGPVKFEPEQAFRAGRPGVAVGLAWTPVGGDILFVESTCMPGRGALKLTGSLGDVMRESAEAARSWLRTNSAKLGFAPAIFETSDIHLHVPQGAVPKDGPSAGIAMVVALASLLTGRSPAPDVAMTGEITLRGKVLPIGGVKEKVLAARRAGIRRVLLPAENRRDVAEIQPELVAGLTFDYVKRIDEALAHILPPAH